MRTKFVDQTAIKDKNFNKVIISLHKNQNDIENMLKKAGHGALFQDHKRRNVKGVRLLSYNRIF